MSKTVIHIPGNHIAYLSAVMSKISHKEGILLEDFQVVVEDGSLELRQGTASYGVRKF